MSFLVSSIAGCFKFCSADRDINQDEEAKTSLRLILKKEAIAFLPLVYAVVSLDYLLHRPPSIWLSSVCAMVQDFRIP